MSLSQFSSIQSIIKYNQTTTSSGYPSSITDPTVVLWLDARNPNSYSGSGTTWKDLKSGNNATLYNGCGYSSSLGGSIYFDSGTTLAAASGAATTAQYAQVPNGLYFQPSCSISSWYYINSFHQYCRLFEFSNGGEYQDVGITTCMGSQNQLLAYVDTNTLAPSKVLQNGAWYHVVFTITSGSSVLYLNGSSLASGNVGTPDQVSHAYCYIARSQDSGNGSFNGGIGQFVLYNYAMNSTQVSTLYNSTKTNYSPLGT